MNIVARAGTLIGVILLAPAAAQGETQIAGHLTMHGQTQPATLSVRLTGVTADEAPGLTALQRNGFTRSALWGYGRSMHGTALLPLLRLTRP